MHITTQSPDHIMLLDEASQNHPDASQRAESSDRLRAVAATWADHFGKTRSPERELFIENYMRRATEQRFWAVGTEVAGRNHAACRLGKILFFYDGKLVQARHLGRRPSSSWQSDRHSIANENWLWGGQLYTRMELPLITPEGSHVGKLVRRLKPVFAKKIVCAAVFDSMTTFSKAYRKLALEEARADVNEPYISGSGSQDARYTAPRTTFYMKLGASTLKQFLAYLDPEILRTVRGVGCPSYTLYNWIAAGDVQRRIQAVRAYPLIIPYKVISWERNKARDSGPASLPPFGMHGKSMQLGDLVDRGEKIAPFLAQELNCPERTLKAVSAIPVHHAGSALRLIGQYGWSDALVPITKAIGLGNRRPASKAQWATWFQLLSTLPWQLVDVASQNGWASFLAGMPEWTSDEWQQLFPRIRDMADMDLGYLEVEGEEPVAPPLPDWPLRRYLALSERWHEARDELTQSMAKKDEELSQRTDYAWKRMLPQGLVHEPTGVEIVELVIPEHLYQEGRELRHCVDGYSNYCYSGESRIVSFRKAGKSLGTAEFCLKPFKNQPSLRHLYCAQFRGHRNAAIAAKSPEGQAFAWLQRQINGRKIEVALYWPDVPMDMRPKRMQDRASQVKQAMKRWLQERIGPHIGVPAGEARCA